MNGLSVCMVAAEVAPYSKVGGLGEVTAALARHLAGRGHDVRLFSPLYRAVDPGDHPFDPVEGLQQVKVRLAGGEIRFSVFRSGEGRVHLVDCPELYGRDGIYSGAVDEHVRFALLCRSALESCQRLGWSPQIVHLHDWHTALVPAYLKTLYAWDRLLARARSVLTIHNVGYQGVFGAGVLADLDLAHHSWPFDPEDLAADRLSFLKTGVLHADLLTTVSPNHAREIQTDVGGKGLGPLLRSRADELVGILNGVDYSIWDPRTDPLIPRNYSPEDLSGKEDCKRLLMEQLGLPYESGIPLLGMISRLTVQKGIDLLPALMEPLEAGDVRLAVLGSGDQRYEEFLQLVQERFPGRVAFHRGFSEQLAHRIEAGADIFLMPSLYEPCGLNQMYSLRYGTVPVVHRTGGLADSVEPWNQATGEGTGLIFEHFTPQGLRWALNAAVEAYGEPASWRRLMLNGMSRDFSWDRQVEEYERVYERLL